MIDTSRKILEWIDKTTEAEDTIRLQPANFMEATLNRTPQLKEGDNLPPLWHWIYFLEAKPESDLGRDAHPKKGDFLPPIQLPRRMWAGGRFTFYNDLVIGEKAKKITTIRKIVEKEGSTGPLCFITLEHKIYSKEEISMIEEQDLVYLQDQQGSKSLPLAQNSIERSDFSQEIHPSEILLFRYSALTFNGHRIHYDLDYARNVEGYDGLVFHGPLTATLLLDLALKEKNKPIKKYSFRGTAPLSNLDCFWIEGKSEDDSVILWARRKDGVVAMKAKAEF
tara:strand:+ start:588 stop:1427 length:840 start_codon:yes stop_codon:yes gene_type:complete